MKVLVGTAIFIALLLVAMFGVRAYLNSQVSDRDQIVQALERAEEASVRGEPGGVLDLLAEGFQVNEAMPGSTRAIADYVRQSKPEVVFTNREPVIQGDTAVIESPCRLNVKVLGNEVRATIPMVQLHFRKEPSTEFLVIPSSTWKLERVHIPPESIPAGLLPGILNLSL
ncbi:MAG: hypothetical protein ACK4P3_09650 [Fimbriimonadaceae bacterium]